MHLRPARDWNLNWLKIEDDEVTMAKEHPYYYQIQSQLAICEKDYCDFIIWSKKSLIVKRVYLEHQCWSKIVERTTIFHKNVIMPELVGKFYTRGSIPFVDLI